MKKFAVVAMAFSLLCVGALEAAQTTRVRARLGIFRSRVRVVQSSCNSGPVRNAVRSAAACFGGVCPSTVTVEVGSCADGTCEAEPETPKAEPSKADVTVKVRPSISSRILNRSQAAYEHALKEATYLAERLAVGHPFGVAPGCTMAGTGCSFSAEKPNHCYKELPESRLIARAVVRGRDGRFYWSAHYR